MALRQSKPIKTLGTSMMRYVYSGLFTLALPLIFSRLLIRSLKAPSYRKRLLERLGVFKTPEFSKPVIWIHTVSVGEFIAAMPLIQSLLDTQKYQLVVTTMTPTGSERVRESFGDAVFHVYCPYDLPIFVSSFLNRIQAKACIILETELWPNVIHGSVKKECAVMLINGRMSARSAKGYARFKHLSRGMFEALTLAAVQNKTDAERFKMLGLPEKNLTLLGNIKFDLSLNQDCIDQAKELRGFLNPKDKRSIFIAASTHKGEDQIILQAYTKARKKHPQLHLVIVPRHPERFNDVHQLCLSHGYSCLRKSQLNYSEAFKADILLGDTMGELLTMLGSADIAFIGGSFVENGGHNYIEPAAWTLPILSGPSVFNFQVIADELCEVGALTLCNNADELAHQVSELIEHTDEAKKRGKAGKLSADKNRGALNRLLVKIEEQMSSTLD